MDCVFIVTLTKALWSVCLLDEIQSDRNEKITKINYEYRLDITVTHYRLSRYSLWDTYIWSDCGSAIEHAGLSFNQRIGRSIPSYASPCRMWNRGQERRALQIKTGNKTLALHLKTIDHDILSLLVEILFVRSISICICKLWSLNDHQR